LKNAWFIFFRVKENEPKESAVSRFTLRVVQPVDEAAPRAAMRRCRNPPGAHNLPLAARLISSDALPGSTMLAASTG